MSADDVLACAKMMSPLSKTFAALFQKQERLERSLADSQTRAAGEEASADDMAELFALSRAPTATSEDLGEVASADDMAELMAMAGAS